MCTGDGVCNLDLETFSLLNKGKPAGVLRIKSCFKGSGWPTSALSTDATGVGTGVGVDQKYTPKEKQEIFIHHKSEQPSDIQQPLQQQQQPPLTRQPEQPFQAQPDFKDMHCGTCETNTKHCVKEGMWICNSCQRGPVSSSSTEQPIGSGVPQQQQYGGDGGLPTVDNDLTKRLEDIELQERGQPVDGWPGAYEKATHFPKVGGGVPQKDIQQGGVVPQKDIIQGGGLQDKGHQQLDVHEKSFGQGTQQEKIFHQESTDV
jgi:hypothetical protein